MRIILIMLALVCAIRSNAQPAAAGSGSDAFTASESDARARYQAGSRVASAVHPFVGFGNTINTNDGTCTFVASNGLFTYTKREINVWWVTNYTDYQMGYTTDQKQWNLIVSPWGFSDDTNDIVYPPHSYYPYYNDGYNDIYYIGTATNNLSQFQPIYDLTTQTNYIAMPTTSSSSNTTYWVKYDSEHFYTNGITLYTTNTQGPYNLSYVIEGGGNYGSFTIPYATNIDEGLYDYWAGTNIINMVQTNIFVRTNIQIETTGDAFAYSVPGGDDIWNYFGNIIEYNSSAWNIRIEQVETITYSEPMSFQVMETNSLNLLTNINLNDSLLRYNTFDSSVNNATITWNPIVKTFGTTNWYSFSYLYKSIISNGVPLGYSYVYTDATGSPERGSHYPQYTDTSVLDGYTYGYYLWSRVYMQTGYFSVYSPTQTVYISNSLAIYPPLDPFYVWTNQTTNAPDLNLTIKPNYFRTLWLPMLYATNHPYQLAIYPVTNGFVISTNTRQTAFPTLELAARGEKVNNGYISFVTSGAAGYYWTKSQAYLTGNSPSNAPNTNHYLEKLFYTNAPHIGTNHYEKTPTNPPYSFPRGRLGGWPWQLGKRYDYWPTNMDTAGFIYYK